MFSNTFYLANISQHLCFRDNYSIEMFGCLNADIDSSFLPNVKCINYQDTYGVGNPDINMIDDALVVDFVDNRRKILGLSPSTVFLKMADMSFGVGQGCNSVAVFANYSWYTDKKTVNYEYKLGDGTVIQKGIAAIKDKYIKSYIKHFMKNIDISLLILG